MALTLITGRANAGKTGEVHSFLEQTVREGGSAVLLLPTRPDVARAASEFAPKDLAGLTVATFDVWVESIWGTHGDGRRLVTEMRSVPR